jgi:hypothetical protein
VAAEGDLEVVQRGFDLDVGVAVDQEVQPRVTEDLFAPEGAGGFFGGRLARSALMSPSSRRRGGTYSPAATASRAVLAIWAMSALFTRRHAPVLPERHLVSSSAGEVFHGPAGEPRP